jgi:hypothetical protein
METSPVSRRWRKSLEGMKYQRITRGGPSTPPSAEQVTPAVQAWCKALTQGLGSHLSEPVDWDESASQPYFTDGPGWHGYTALLIWAAYAHYPDRLRPTNLPKSWAEDPAFIDSISPESGTPYPQVREVSAEKRHRKASWATFEPSVRAMNALRSAMCGLLRVCRPMR